MKTISKSRWNSEKYLSNSQSDNKEKQKNFKKQTKNKIENLIPNISKVT